MEVIEKLDLNLRNMIETFATIGVEKYLTKIKVNEHHLIADEPLEDNGKNLGPSPFDLLASALSACTLITMKMYADRKDWPLTDFNVTTFYENAGKDDQKLIRKISIPNTYTSEQKERLLTIANKCPVHKILIKSIPIDSILVD